MQELKLLITEDNEKNMELLEAFLEPKAGLLHKTQNGEDAILKVRENSYDIVLMDIQLPGINGIEAMRQIKTIDSTLPVIAVTAFAMVGDEEKYLKAGFDCYLSKPFDLDDLQNSIVSVVSRSQSLRYTNRS